jgi:hypothetical protein
MTPEEEFWEGFRLQADGIREHLMKHNLPAAFESVERILNAAGFDFAFELTFDSGTGVLILTPEGDARSAHAIDQILNVRPSVPGWRFFGRRQPKPLQDAVAFVGRLYERDIADARFLFTSVGDKIDVTMFSSALDDLANDEREGLVATFLDHAIGEDRVMSKIRFMKGSSHPDVGPHLLTKEEAVDRLSRE